MSFDAIRACVLAVRCALRRQLVLAAVLCVVASVPARGQCDCEGPPTAPFRLCERCLLRPAEGIPIDPVFPCTLEGFRAFLECSRGCNQQPVAPDQFTDAFESFFAECDPLHLTIGPEDFAFEFLAEFGDLPSGTEAELQDPQPTPTEPGTEGDPPTEIEETEDDLPSTDKEGSGAGGGAGDMNGEGSCSDSMESDPGQHPDGPPAGSPCPVTVAWGTKTEREVDLRVPLRGTDFEVVRSYSSNWRLNPDADPEAEGGSMGGWGWKLNVFRWLSEAPATGTTERQIRIAGMATDRRVVFTEEQGGVYRATGMSTQVIELRPASGGSPECWRLREPGQWTLDFYPRPVSGDTLPPYDPEAVPPGLAGLPIRYTDQYGNKHVYGYEFFRQVGSEDPADIRARLGEVYLNPTDDSSIAACAATCQVRVRFRYHLRHDVHDSLLGNIEMITVYRRVPAQGGTPAHEVEVENVRYTFAAASSAVHDAVGEEDDLVQVVQMRRVNPRADSPFTYAVTQYRYHAPVGGGTTSHLLRMVIGPEQLEYAAQRMNSAAASPLGAPDRTAVLFAARRIIGMADTSQVFTEPDSGEPVSVLDLAVKTVHYDSLGRVDYEYINSSCGCGGTPKRMRQDFTYIPDSGGEAALWATTVVVERQEVAPGVFTPHRTTYYDMVRPANAAVRRTANKVVVDPSGREWVWHWEYDAGGRVYATTLPSATAAYTPSTLLPLSQWSLVLHNGGGGPGGTGPSVARYTGYSSQGYPNSDRWAAGYPESAEPEYRVPVATTQYSTQANRQHLPTSRTRHAGYPTSIDPAGAFADERTLFGYRFHGGPSDPAARIAVRWVSLKPDYVFQNGEGEGGTLSVRTELFDAFGQLRWTREPDGMLMYREYDALTGQLTKEVRNADPTQPGGDSSQALNWANFGGVPIAGWDGRVSDGGEFVSQWAYDLFGRVIETELPDGSRTHYRYGLLPLADRPGTLFQATAVFSQPADASTPALPTSVVWTNAIGRRLANSGFASTAAPETLESVPAGELSRSRTGWSLHGLRLRDMHWSNLASGELQETRYEYDALGRPTRTVDADGTVRETTQFDVFDRPLNEWTGTSAANMTMVAEFFYDHPTDAYGQSILDAQGRPSQGVGDGNLSFIRRYTGLVANGVAEARDTVTLYDVRGLPIVVRRSTGPEQWFEYDNLGQVSRRADVAAGSANAPRFLSDTRFFRSARQQVYRVDQLLDATRGPAAGALTQSTWYDENGRVVARAAPGGGGEKFRYDAHGRVVDEFATDRGGDAAPGAPGSLADAVSLLDDRVSVQAHNTYDSSGRLSLRTSYQRAHDASAIGPLAEAAPGDAVPSYTGYWYDGLSRATRTVQLGTATAASASSLTGVYAAPSLPPAWPPASQPEWDGVGYADALVTGTEFNTRGQREASIDAKGRVTRWQYDDAARVVAVIENFQAAEVAWVGVSSQSGYAVSGLTPTDSSLDRVTTFAYTGANRLQRRAGYLASGTSGVPQVTTYEYGVSKEGPNPSLVAAGGLLARVIYPDGGITRSQYNALGETIASVDQNGTRHEYTRDPLGRVTADHVAVVGDPGSGLAPIDGTVRTIETTYDERGLVAAVLSKHADTSVANAVAFTYSPLGQVRRVYQNQAGPVAVAASGEPTAGTRMIAYAYEAVAAQAEHFAPPTDHAAITSPGVSRPRSVVYSDGTTIETLRTGLDAVWGRTTSLRLVRTQHAWTAAQLAAGWPGFGDNDTQPTAREADWINAASPVDIASYAWLGAGTVASVQYHDPGLLLDRTYGHDGRRRSQTEEPLPPEVERQAAGTYPGMDRFGRVVRHSWIASNTYTIADAGAPGGYRADRSPYVELVSAFDAASNRVSRTDARGEAFWDGRDWAYDHDGLNRLRQAVQSPRNGVNGVRSESQRWTLDPLGNWSSVATDADADGDFASAEAEARTHNLANDIASRTPAAASGGSQPLALTHDHAGNLRQEPHGDEAGTRYVYDAWHRLVRVLAYDPSGSGEAVVRENRYNGLHWRVETRVDTSETVSGVLNQRRVQYYGADWRLLEEEVYDHEDTDPGQLDVRALQVWGPRGLDDAVCRMTGGPVAPAEEREHTYYLTDEQGSVVALVDGAGAVKERVRYDAYGVPSQVFGADYSGDGVLNPDDLGDFITAYYDSPPGPEVDWNHDGALDPDDLGDFITEYFAAFGRVSGRGTLSGFDNPVGYCGYIYDCRWDQPEASTYLVRFRVLSPRLGRWLQRDPAGFVDGMNLLEYVRSNPLAFHDPFGLCGGFVDLVTDFLYDVASIAGQPSANAVRVMQSAAEGAHDGSIATAQGAADAATFGLASEAVDFNAAMIDPSTPYLDVSRAAGGVAFAAGAGAVNAASAASVGAREAGVLGRTARAAKEGTEAAKVTRGGIDPVVKGRNGVARAVSELEAGGSEVVGRNVTLQANGVRTQPDLLVRNPQGKLEFVEVKAGPTARLSANQSAGFPAIRAGGAVPVGGNAAKAGLPVGLPLPATPVRVIYYP